MSDEVVVRRAGGARDYSRPGHCGTNAEPVDSTVTGEILAWLCPTCGVSWHKGDLPPGRGRTIVLRHPVDHLVEDLLTGLSVVWAVLFMGALALCGPASLAFVGLLLVGAVLGIAIGIERTTRPE